LLSDEWVAREILCAKPRHPLGLWHTKNPSNPILLYLDDLVDFVLSSGAVKCDTRRLAQKLKAKGELMPTLLEMDYAMFLGRQQFAVTMEPLSPGPGPDLGAVKGDQYYVEACKVGLDDAAEAFDRAVEEISKRLRNSPSRYRIIISMTETYSAHSTELKNAVRAVQRTLRQLAKEEPTTTTLYYYSPNDCVLDTRTDIRLEFDYTNGAKLASQIKWSERAKNAPFIAQFVNTGKESERTAVYIMKHRLNVTPYEAHRRLRKTLDDKRERLPEGSRGIIVLELSEPWQICNDTLESALYGDELITFQVDADAAVDTLEHAHNGFFVQTSRVSAVVAEWMHVGDKVEFTRLVFPTNNPRAKLLTRAELAYFGAVPRNLARLCADEVGSGQVTHS